ncbi:MAG: hypothetical protein CR961_01380 [Polaribacter sp.]|nr:MAG: hypothetical protein CR961_01380 [Polaribacter sp.]
MFFSIDSNKNTIFAKNYVTNTANVVSYNKYTIINNFKINETKLHFTENGIRFIAGLWASG